MKKIIQKINTHTWVALGLILILTPIILFTIFKPQQTRADWYSTGGTWLYRKKIVIQNGQVSGAADLSNFPVLIDITDADLANHAQTDGDDILFTNSSGTKLDHEIESYTSGTGDLVAWVEVDTVNFDIDTTIYMYFGESDVASQESVTATWDGDYQAVWHFGENTGTAVADSTSNSNDMTLDNSDNWTTADAKIGSAYDFDGAENASTNASFSGPTTGTVEFWLRVDSAIDSRPFGLDDAWEFRLQDASGAEIDLQIVGGNGVFNTTQQVWPLGKWIHFAIVYNATDDDYEVFINGASDNTGSAVGMSTSTFSGTLDIGDSHSTGNFFNGPIDEFRVSTTERTQGWLVTTYNNQYDPNAFIELGSIETEDASPPIVYWRFDEGVDNTCEGGTNDACDSSGSQVDIFGTGDPIWQTENMCISGKCLLFEGTNERLSSTDHNILDWDSDDSFTISGWFRAPPGSSERPIYLKGTGTGVQVNMASDGDIQCGIDDDGTSWPEDEATTTTADYDDNKWHHFSCVYADDTSLTLYIDGNQVAQDATISATGSLANVNNVNIGYDGTNYYAGFLDEIKIYNYARSSAQVKADFGARGGGSASAVLGAQDTSFLNDGLAGYWPLDESSGNASDSSGNATTLTNVSTTAFSEAKFGNGAEPDGTADYFDAVDNAALSVTGDLTLAAWIEPDDVTGDEAILSKFDDADESYLLMLTGDEIRMYIDSSSNYETTDAANLSADTLYHVAGVYDSNTATVNLFVNGTLEASTTTGTIPSSIGDDAGEFALGAEDTGGTPANFFNGHIDEARVYNRALSAAEVSKLYNWAPSPIAHFKLDENTGTSTAYDTSGNEYNATLTGTFSESDWTTGRYGSSLDFRASDQLANFYSSSFNTDFSGDQGTAMAWFKVNSSAWTDATERSLINIAVGTDDSVYLNKSSASNNFVFYYEAGATVDSYSHSTSTTDWTHVAITWDASEDQAIYYFNGVQVSSDTGLGTWSGNLATDRVVFGGFDTDLTTLLWDGLIDDVRVYNYPRTPSQIVEDMNAGHPAGGSPIGSQTLYYKFDEAQGTTANNTIEDQSSLTGSISGASWNALNSSNCKFNSCLDFDGTDDVVTTTNADAIDFDVGLSSGFTFTTWFNADTDGENNTGEMFQKGASTYCRTDNESAGSLDVECNLDLATTDANVNVSAGATTNTWHHLALVYDDASTITVYIDGRQRGTDTGSGATSADTSDLLIGGGTSDNFDGTIDDFKIYNSALTSDEILIDMSANSAINSSTGQIEAADLADGAGNDPISHFSFDANTGTTTAYDVSGNGNDATMTSFSEGDWIHGKYGSGLNFTGSNYLSPGTTTTMGSTTGSIATWFKTTNDFSDHAIMVYLCGDPTPASCEDGFGLGDEIHIGLDANETITFYTEGSDDESADTTLTSTASSYNDGEWHHAVATWDQAGTAYLYVDGTQNDSDTANINDRTLDTNLKIGTTGNLTRDFIGQLDQIKIWDYQLTPAQVAYEYNRGRPTGHWKLDECEGSTANDSSGNANNGTITPGAGTHTSVGTCSSGSASEMWDDGQTGKRNHSLDFDGDDDYVDMNDVAIFDYNDQDFTITGWFNRETFTTDDTIVAKKNDQLNSTAGFVVWIDDSSDDLRLVVSDGDSTNLHTVDSTSTFTITGWYHFAIVYDDSSATGSQIYINGYDDNATNTTSGTFGSINNLSNAVDFRIGSESDSGAPFAGELDDIRMYNYALSASQVRKLVNDDAGTRFGPDTGAP